MAFRTLIYFPFWYLPLLYCFPIKCTVNIGETGLIMTGSHACIYLNVHQTNERLAFTSDFGKCERWHKNETIRFTSIEAQFINYVSLLNLFVENCSQIQSKRFLLMHSMDWRGLKKCKYATGNVAGHCLNNVPCFPYHGHSKSQWVWMRHSSCGISCTCMCTRNWETKSFDIDLILTASKILSKRFASYHFVYLCVT